MLGVDRAWDSLSPSAPAPINNERGKEGEKGRKEGRREGRSFSEGRMQ